MKKKSISERDKKVIWHPYTQQKLSALPIAIVSAKDTWIYDEEGNKYLDAVSSWWVNLHGHSNSYIAKKVSEQLNCLEHVIFAGFTHEPAVRLAERLLEILPENQGKVFYSDNGSTAVEAGVKMAIQYWYNQGKDKKKIIAFRHSYHGDTFGSMSVSERSAFTLPFKSHLFEVEFIDPPLSGNAEKSLEQIKVILENKDIAAFIFEPLVMGTGGMLMYPAEALDQLIELCRNNGVLCIADEVMTGFGRTARLFASDHLKNKPDIICLSKGITGGTMALGATTCTEKIYNAFYSDNRKKTFFHGHSYTANPLACTAALASLDLLLNENCTKSIANITYQHSEFAKKINNFDKIRNLRQCGTILAIEMDEQSKGANYFSSIRDQIYNWFIKRKILIRPLGNVIYLMPPYCITNNELELLYTEVENFLNQ